MNDAFAEPRMAEIRANLPQNLLRLERPDDQRQRRVFPHPGADAGDRVRAAGRRRSHPHDLSRSDQRLRCEVRAEVGVAPSRRWRSSSPPAPAASAHRTRRVPAGGADRHRPGSRAHRAGPDAGHRRGRRDHRGHRPRSRRIAVCRRTARLWRPRAERARRSKSTGRAVPRAAGSRSAFLTPRPSGVARARSGFSWPRCFHACPSAPIACCSATGTTRIAASILRTRWCPPAIAWPIVAQRRAADQHELTIDYLMRPVPATHMSAGISASIVAAAALSALLIYGRKKWRSGEQQVDREGAAERGRALPVPD